MSQFSSSNVLQTGGGIRTLCPLCRLSCDRCRRDLCCLSWLLPQLPQLRHCLHDIAVWGVCASRCLCRGEVFLHMTTLLWMLCRCSCGMRWNTVIYKPAVTVSGKRTTDAAFRLLTKVLMEVRTLTNRLNAEAARVLAGVPSALKRPSGSRCPWHRPHTFLLVSSELECRPYTLPHLNCITRCMSERGQRQPCDLLRLFTCTSAMVAMRKRVDRKGRMRTLHWCTANGRHTRSGSCGAW